MNGWDLKILYRDLESWKKMDEKKNGMEWFGGLRKLKKKMKNWNRMERVKWIGQTKGNL